ncbi:MAG: hypothetical protein SWK76_04000 [Actinomycetota bacterium]|nr:hypothetical protein [Actinomycetota bacterium]
MAGFHGGVERSERIDTQGMNQDKPRDANLKTAREPWYQVAREAAQILVSALALYASVKAFLEKIKKRRDFTRQEEV